LADDATEETQFQVNQCPKEKRDGLNERLAEVIEYLRREDNQCDLSNSSRMVMNI